MEAADARLAQVGEPPTGERWLSDAEEARRQLAGKGQAQWGWGCRRAKQRVVGQALGEVPQW